MISQLGRIWSKNRKEIRILQSLTAFAFFALFLNNDKKSEDDETTNFNNSI